jgi:hypothetical protein
MANFGRTVSALKPGEVGYVVGRAVTQDEHGQLQVDPDTSLYQLPFPETSYAVARMVDNSGFQVYGRRTDE